ELTDGFTGAELASVCNRAAITALRRYVAGQNKSVKEIKISQQDLVDATLKVKPKTKFPAVA
ncbi:MAG TPA: hypothetical protein HA290_02250, partial [Candidatus Nitrosotenuis sp.]|nr:hypothetical protein [Candidatus Nitrosotenuis sp.]